MLRWGAMLPLTPPEEAALAASSSVVVVAADRPPFPALSSTLEAPVCPRTLSSRLLLLSLPWWDDCSYCTRRSRNRAAAWVVQMTTISVPVAAPAAIDFSMIPMIRDVSSMAAPRVPLTMVSWMFVDQRCHCCPLECNRCHCCCCLGGVEWYIRTMIHLFLLRSLVVVVARSEEEVVEIVDSDSETAFESMSMAVEWEAEAVAVALAGVETADD